MRLSHIHNEVVVEGSIGNLLSQLVTQRQIAWERNDDVIKQFPQLKRLISQATTMKHSIVASNERESAEWWYNAAKTFGIPKDRVAEVVRPILDNVASRVNVEGEYDKKDRMAQKKKKKLAMLKKAGLLDWYDKDLPYLMEIDIKTDDNYVSDYVSKRKKSGDGILGKLGGSNLLNMASDLLNNRDDPKVKQKYAKMLDWMNPSKWGKMSKLMVRQANNERAAHLAIQGLYDVAKENGWLEDAIAGQAEEGEWPEEHEIEVEPEVEPEERSPDQGAIDSATQVSQDAEIAKKKIDTSKDEVIGRVKEMQSYIRKRGKEAMADPDNPEVADEILNAVVQIKSKGYKDEYVPLYKTLNAVVEICASQSDAEFKEKYYQASQELYNLMRGGEVQESFECTLSRILG